MARSFVRVVRPILENDLQTNKDAKAMGLFASNSF